MVGGRFNGTVDFDPGAGTDNKTGGTFISRINSDGSYDWAHGIASSGIYAIGADGQDGVYAAGGFQNTVDFNPGASTDNKTSNGSGDASLTKFTSDGTYQYTYAWGSTGYDYAGGVDFDSDSNVYINGEFAAQTDFDPGVGVDLINAPDGDFFISKFMSDGTYDRTFHSSTSSGSYRYYQDNSMIAIDNNDDIYTSGIYSGTVDLDFTDGVENFTTSVEDIFITKIDQTILQQITNLDPTLTAKTLSDTDATGNNIERGTATTIRLSTTDNIPLADVTTTFTTDLDWSSVTADVDPDTGKAFVHNLTAADGTSGTYTLYVPKLAGHNTVGVCPGANSLTAVSNTCTGLYYLTEGEDDNLITVTIDSQAYWAISGLTGTGGFSTAVPTNSDTAQNQDANQDTLADTGQNTNLLILIATTLLILGLHKTRKAYAQ